MFHSLTHWSIRRWRRNFVTLFRKDFTWRFFLHDVWQVSTPKISPSHRSYSFSSREHPREGISRYEGSTIRHFGDNDNDHGITATSMMIMMVMTFLFPFLPWCPATWRVVRSIFGVTHPSCGNERLIVKRSSPFFLPIQSCFVNIDATVSLKNRP